MPGKMSPGVRPTWPNTASPPRAGGRAGGPGKQFNVLIDNDVQWKDNFFKKQFGGYFFSRGHLCPHTGPLKIGLDRDSGCLMQY